jgi:hypothetical protein
VAVIERYTTPGNLPRVGIVHDDVMRMFQDVGCLERVQPAMPSCRSTRWPATARSRVEQDRALATHGWPGSIAFQPAFETELDILARADLNIDVFRRKRVSIGQDRTAGSPERADAADVIRGSYLTARRRTSLYAAPGHRVHSFGSTDRWSSTARPRPAAARSDVPPVSSPNRPMTMRIGPTTAAGVHAARRACGRGDEGRTLALPPGLEGGTSDEFEIIRALLQVPVAGC